MKRILSAIVLIAIAVCAVMSARPAPIAIADSEFVVHLPLIMKGAADGQPTDPTPPPADPATMRAQVVAAVNAERQKAGCALVTEDATLTQAAQAWTDYMVAHNILAHSSSVDYDWYINHGYTETDWVSENIAGGQDTGAQAVADWMDDAGHRAVVLQSCENTTGVFQVGVGWQYHTWTLAVGELHD